MTKRELDSAIIDEVDDVIYVTDMETDEILYMNRTCRQISGLENDEQWKGRKCHEVIYGEASPCTQCPHDALRCSGTYSRERFNKKNGKYYLHKHRVLNVDGREAKLMIASDVTSIRKTTGELMQRLTMEEMLVKCVKMLYDNENMDTAIQKLLSIVATYYKADRTYIFELDHENGTMDNTYEWCARGVVPQKENLQKVEMSIIDRWFVKFKNEGQFFITCLGEDIDVTTDEYKLLKDQDIDSLIACPLMVDGKIVGFIGADNTKSNTDNLILMQSIAAFVINDMQKKKNLMKLNELSYNDRLTGLGNRHAYVMQMAELEKNPDIPLGIVFADINGLKKVNDVYGHEAGDDMIKKVAANIKRHFGHNIYRIGGDEFVIFCPGIRQEDFAVKVDNLTHTWDDKATASIGEIWLPHCKNIEEQVKNTDRHMYMNKQKFYREQKTQDCLRKD